MKTLANMTQQEKLQAKIDFVNMCETAELTKSDRDYGAILKFKHKKTACFIACMTIKTAHIH